MGLPPHEILEKGVARTFQNLRLFLNLTVMDNALVGQHARLKTGVLQAIFRPPSTRAEEKGAREWAMEIFSIFGNRLMPRVEQMVVGLSYANRRRIEIARALASRPRILLLDEPTAGMNPAETLELAEQIKSLNDLGLTVLLIEHKLDVVTTLADTVYVLDHGDVIAAGQARRGAPERGGAARLSRAQRAGRGGGSRLIPAARIQERRHLLRRPACAEAGQLHDRAGRDRRTARRQCLAASPPR